MIALGGEVLYACENDEKMDDPFGLYLNSLLLITINFGKIILLYSPKFLEAHSTLNATLKVATNLSN